jgi:HK97 family phage portal protein
MWGDEGWTPMGSLSPYGLPGFYPQRYLQENTYFTVDQAFSVSAVFACVRVIAESLATCEWNVYARDGQGGRNLLRNDNLYWLLNHRPNPQTPAAAFREKLVADALTFGHAFAIIERDNSYRPYELRLVSNPESARLVWDPDALELLYEFNILGEWHGYREDQVYHLRGPMNGDSIVARAFRAIGLYREAETFSTAFFANNAVMGGVIKKTKNVVIPKAEEERLEAQLKARHEGSSNAGRILWQPDGLEFVQNQIEGDKTGMIESRKFSKEEIATFFGVPPHKIGILDRATFSNIEHQGIDWVHTTLRPWAKRLQEEADYKLLSERSPKLTELDLSPLRDGDSKTRAEAHAIYLSRGVMSVNEVRSATGQNRIPDGDLHTIEGNVTILSEENLTKPAPHPQPPPEEEPEEEGDQEQDEQEEAPEQTDAAAVEALANLVATTLERHGRRIKARRADLERTNHPADRIEGNLTAERIATGAVLTDLLRVAGTPRDGAAIKAALAAVEAGIEPAKAAAHMIGATHV